MVNIRFDWVMRWIMANAEPTGKTDRTHEANPFASVLDRMLQDKAARPQDVYRLAVIMQGLLDSLDDPKALETLRFELRALINDMASTGKM